MPIRTQPYCSGSTGTTVPQLKLRVKTRAAIPRPAPPPAAGVTASVRLPVVMDSSRLASHRRVPIVGEDSVLHAHILISNLSALHLKVPVLLHRLSHGGRVAETDSRQSEGMESSVRCYDYGWVRIGNNNE